MTERRHGQAAESGCEYDVCVVGGGPGGASLALRLGQLGRRVALVEKAVFPRQHVGESLAAGILPLLDALGVRQAVESAGFLPAAWATVDWAGERRRYRHGVPGLLVDRGHFDALLLGAAAAIPLVHAYQPAQVVRASRESSCWRVTLDSGESLRARYLAEASGRARVRVCPRPRALSRRPIGARTLALYAYWRGAGAPSEETLVESGQDAWYWGAPLPGGELNAAVFVDPSTPRDYERLIARSKLLAPRLRGAQRVSRVHVCDATPFVDLEPCGTASIKVGDAALCIDPLSAQGVQTAIGTALHAAVVVNTLLDRPDDAEMAVEFYRSRLRDSAEFHAKTAAELYRRQAAAVGGSFWLERATNVEPVLRPPLPAPASRVARSRHLRFAPVAVAEATYIVQTDGVQANDNDYAFVGPGIAIAPLLRQIDVPMTAFEVVERWSRRLPAGEALQVLRWAWSRELIVGEG